MGESKTVGVIEILNENGNKLDEVICDLEVARVVHESLKESIARLSDFKLAIRLNEVVPRDSNFDIARVITSKCKHLLAE